MAVPSRDLGDLLLTDWAQTALFFPQMDQPLFPLEGLYHFHVQTFFIVAFPHGIIRVGLSSDFDVSFDRHMGGICEKMRVLITGSRKDPVVASDGFEVFLRNPCVSFSWVASVRPLFDHSIDRVVYSREGVFAHHMLMVERPSPDDGVELHDQLCCT